MASERKRSRLDCAAPEREVERRRETGDDDAAGRGESPMCDMRDGMDERWACSVCRDYVTIIAVSPTPFRLMTIGASVSEPRIDYARSNCTVRAIYRNVTSLSILETSNRQPTKSELLIPAAARSVYAYVVCFTAAKFRRILGFLKILLLNTCTCT